MSRSLIFMFLCSSISLATCGAQASDSDLHLLKDKRLFYTPSERAVFDQAEVTVPESVKTDEFIFAPIVDPALAADTGQSILAEQVKPEPQASIIYSAWLATAQGYTVVINGVPCQFVSLLEQSADNSQLPGAAPDAMVQGIGVSAYRNQIDSRVYCPHLPDDGLTIVFRVASRQIQILQEQHLLASLSPGQAF